MLGGVVLTRHSITLVRMMFGKLNLKKLFGYYDYNIVEIIYEP